MTSSDSKNGEVVFWALNGYGVTISDIVFVIIGFVVAIFIILLNSLVLDTMLRRRWQMEPLHVMVCSLALADLLNGVILVYHTLYNIINFQVYTECLVRLGAISSVVVTSVLHLVGLTFDRYMKIMWPFHYMKFCQVKHAVAASGAIWGFALIFACLPAMGWSLESKEPTNQTSSTEPVCSYFGLMAPNYIRLLIGLFLIPFSFMACVYIFLFRVAKKHARSIAAQEDTVVHTKRGDRHVWKYTKTVVLIVGLYFGSWAPSGAVLIMVTSGYLDDWTLFEQGSLLMYVSSVAFVNSIINPLVYAVKITAVRLRFREVFCCRKKRDLVVNLASVNFTTA